MAATPRRTRLLLRYTHLLVGALLNIYVYLPPSSAGPLRLFLMFVGVPAVVLSGVAMWKQAALRRLVRRLTVTGRGGRPAARPARERAVSA